MPPGLISSAAPGKKATAPKAAPRRRAAAAIPSGPPPSVAVAAPPTPEPTQTQTQSQAPVVDGALQQEGTARADAVEKEAPAPAETVAENVPPAPPVVPAEAEAEVVEREREAETVAVAVAVGAIPTPEPTQTEPTQQSGVDARVEDGKREEQARRQAELAKSSRQEEALREATRQEEAREAQRQEELAVQVRARQTAEREEEARRSEADTALDVAPPTFPTAPTTTNEANATSQTNYVPPSASSATPATVDPTTLPLPPRPVAASKPTSKRPRAEKSATAAPRPAKKAKTSSTRSNAKVQTVVNGEDEGEGEETGVVNTTETDATQPKSKQKRKPATKKKGTTAGRKRKEMSAATIQNSDDENEGQPGQEEQEAEDEDAQPAPKKPRKPRAKRAAKKKPPKSAAQPGTGEAAAEGEGEAGAENGEGNGDEDSDASDPELHEIDPNTISMWELSRDKYYGKKSERGKKMEEIDWEKVKQDRRDAADALAASLRTDLPDQADPSDDVIPSVEGPTGTAEPEGSQGRRSQSRTAATAAVEPTPAPANNDLGLGFVLDADGNIIADENTLTFTRDAAAQAAANSDAPVEEFTDLTQNFNRFTHLHANRRDPADRLPIWKSKSDPWSEDETDKFYDALRMFGTDFFIISKMFAPKTRRMIKNKFNREEKLDPKRVTRALTGIVETPMSLEHYSRETGFAMEKFTKFDGVEHAQSVIDSENVGKEVVDEREAKRREKEIAKEEKEKEKEREREERRAKRKARTKKGMAEAGGGFGGGGPIEDVVGDAD